MKKVTLDIVSIANKLLLITYIAKEVFLFVNATKICGKVDNQNVPPRCQDQSVIEGYLLLSQIG